MAKKLTPEERVRMAFKSAGNLARAANFAANRSWLAAGKLRRIVETAEIDCDVRAMLKPVADKHYESTRALSVSASGTRSVILPIARFLAGDDA